ncbi:unnamed protein product [Clonostachys rosea]|uniref:Uncharacterized protein n=1 Tax=Bionectria ochroleuca TaxID=29856 RepID=A0ABY6V0M6_BIOOC|nr:unnamed protein product [Clonostachys rosea]
MGSPPVTSYATDAINRRKYVPADSVRRLVNKQSITSELKRKQTLRLSFPNIATQVEKQSSKLFLTLAHLDKARDIKGLLKAGFTDDDLPLKKIDDNALQISSEPRKVFKTPKDWSEQTLDSFVEKQ